MSHFSSSSSSYRRKDRTPTRRSARSKSPISSSRRARRSPSPTLKQHEKEQKDKKEQDKKDKKDKKEVASALTKTATSELLVNEGVSICFHDRHENHTFFKYVVFFIVFYMIYLCCSI